VPQASSQSDPSGTGLWLGWPFVGRRHQVVVADLALFLLFLLWAGSRSLTLLFLGLSLAESDNFFPVGMINGQIKELADGFRLLALSDGQGSHTWYHLGKR
jgi:hypothetical protein